jgi:hypothetical protein
MQEIENKKQNYYIDNFTQTNLFNKNLTFDKQTQTNKTQTFDTFTQTTLKEIFKTTGEMGVQCNKIVFTKNILTQTEVIQEQAPATNQASSNYMDNKLNDLLKNSFNNYTNRRPTTNQANTILNNTPDEKKSRLFKFQSKTPSNKQISSDNLTLKRLNENFNTNIPSMSASSKRVRLSEPNFEIDNLEDNDFNNLNQDF